MCLSIYCSFMSNPNILVTLVLRHPSHHMHPGNTQAHVFICSMSYMPHLDMCFMFCNLLFRFKSFDLFVCQVYVVSSVAGREYWMLLECWVWVLGTKPRISVRAVSALSHWASSPFNSPSFRTIIDSHLQRIFFFQLHCLHTVYVLSTPLFVNYF